VVLESRGVRSRDVGESDVYESARQCSLGQRMRSALVLEYLDWTGALVVGCEGEVVCVECLDGRTGVAIRFSAYGFKQREMADVVS
jgi:hypothetical protein